MTQVSDTDLSIIIPVYQVSEELLLRCLKSVQEIQDLRKEVILVADGPDQEVCSNPAIQAFAGEAEFKISFYEKQHEGVSAARNYGIDHAGGTWIFFMDADDYICADAFRKVCPLLKKEEIDLAVMDYSMIQGEECSRHYYKKEMELDIRGIRTGKIRRRKCFVYIMHEERKIGVPSLSYVSTCLQGYISFGFDEHYLSEAQIKAVEVAGHEE